MKKIYILLLFAFFSQTAYSQYWKEMENLPTAYKNNYWLDVFFSPSNSNYGWICGFNGMIIRTTDGGNSWAGSSIKDINHLEHVHFPSLQTGYVSGPDGIFKSTDGGATWNDISPTMLIGTSWGCYFVDDNNGILVGGGCVSNQDFWKTTNGGTTWNLYQDNVTGSGLTDVLLYDKNGLGYAVSSGLVWVTNDGGLSWQVFSGTGSKVWQEEITHFGNSFLLPYAGTDCQGWGPDGGVRFTTNNGASWLEYETGVHMFGSFLINSNKGWACGDDKNVIFTDDGGLSWFKKSCGLRDGNYDDIWFINENEGWVVGAGVYKLSRAEYSLSKDSIVLENVCLGQKGFDTILVSNLSFNRSNVKIQFNSPTTDIKLYNTPLDFMVDECSTFPIIVEYTATKDTSYQLSFNISINSASPDEKNYIIPVKVTTLKPTVFLASDYIVVDKVVVGTLVSGKTTLYSESGAEFLIDFIDLSKNQNIKLFPILPGKIFKNGTELRYEINLPDTGWYEARYQLFFDRCGYDTIITIRAYGVSPIIQSSHNSTHLLVCNNYDLDTIVIYNTGNDELIISEYGIEPLTSDIIIRGFAGSNKLPFSIKSKDSAKLVLEYIIKTPGSYKHILSLKNNDKTTANGVKSPHLVNLDIFYSKPDLISEKLIDFGEICVNQQKELNFDIENLGNLDATVYLNNNVLNVFDFSFPNQQSSSIIRQSNKLNCSLKFSPKNKGIFKDTLIFLSSPCNDTLKVIVMGTAISSELSVSPDKIDTIFRSGDVISRIITIKSIDRDVIIKKVYIENMNPDWSFSHDLIIPMVLLIGQETNFKVEFSANKESTLKTRIVIESSSICDNISYIDIDLNTFSRIITVSPLYVDFQTTYCFLPENLQQIIDIENLGFGQDTIVKIELLGNDFKINNLPTLPYIMDAGDIYKLELSFLPQSEGKKSGSLIIQTIEPNAQAFTIDLYGEYYKTYTSLNKHSVDFGNVEFCQINNIDSILISNNGLLSDTLDIFVEGDRDIVNITPNDFIFVNNSSDVTFIINLVNDRLKAGLNNVKIELVSRVCSNTMQIDISANLIKPVLVINPNPLDFGELWMSEEKTLPLELTNNSNVDIEINDIELISNQFEVIGEKSFIIPANSIHSIMIKFTAKLEGIHDLPLKILYQTNCLDSGFVRLLSFVPNEEYSLTLRIDRHIVDAGGVVEIPIILDKVLSNISSDLVEINLQFDKELFYPLEVLPKNLNPKDFSFQYLAGNLDIKIVGESAHKLFLDSGDIILLKGITFASIPDSTSLEFTKIELNLNKPVNIYHQDGLLKLTDFCNGTAIFKLKWIPTFDASIPQVLDNDILKFTISASENININMEVIDANGILINRETLFATTNPNNFNIPFGEISNGLYFIKLSSSYKTKLYKMIFIR